MAIQYQRDDVRRRVVISFRGMFQTEDGWAAIERHHAAGAWTYGVLYDLRTMQGYPDVTDLKRYMERDAQTPAGEQRPRGPIAILTTDPILYGLACTYAALGPPTMKIAVFRDGIEADQWLVGGTSQLT